MTTIVIKDLPENIELDRQAMVAISGGARNGAHSVLRSTRVDSNHTGSTVKLPSGRYVQSVIRKPHK
jgi:hypothetical protein